MQPPFVFTIPLARRATHPPVPPVPLERRVSHSANSAPLMVPPVLQEPVLASNHGDGSRLSDREIEEAQALVFRNEAIVQMVASVSEAEQAFDAWATEECGRLQNVPGMKVWGQQFFCDAFATRSLWAFVWERGLPTFHPAYLLRDVLKAGVEDYGLAPIQANSILERILCTQVLKECKLENAVALFEAQKAKAVAESELRTVQALLPTKETGKAEESRQLEVLEKRIKKLDGQNAVLMLIVEAIAIYYLYSFYMSVSGFFSAHE